MFKHLLLFSVLLAFASASLHLDLLTATAEELSFHLAIGHISSVQLVQRYLAQIEAHNENGLGLRAVIEVAPKSEVLDIAGRLDYERRIGRSRGPLHGIPILVKVCMCGNYRKLLSTCLCFVTECLYILGNDYRTTSRHTRNWV